MTYFKYCEFYRLLEKIVLNESGMYHCHADTIALLKQILYSDYEYQKDDIEYIMDMINYYMNDSGYSGKKSRFPLCKYLDLICQGDFYIMNQ